jgi:replicative DNA helicase
MNLEKNNGILLTEKLENVEAITMQPEPISIKTWLGRAMDKMQLLFECENAISGAPTGFSGIDKLICGLHPGNLIVMASRPSMGKTTLALNMAENIVLKEGDRPVVFFSLESSGEELSMRLMASMGRIDTYKIRTGQMEDEDWPHLTSAISLLAGTQLFIDDASSLTVINIADKANKIAQVHGQLGLIVVDCLHLLEPNRSDDSRKLQIADMSRRLKALAKDLNVPVVVLSQLNRNLEQRPNKRPVLSDLRDVPSIEEDADQIIFIYRDEVYNEDSQDKGIAEIIIGKNRNGPLGNVRLRYFVELSRFEDFNGIEP